MRKKCILAKNAEDYASRATVHGIGCVFDKEVAILDRALWLIIVLGALCLAMWMINTSYTSWQDNQVITTLKTTTKPITDLDFPAITICAAGQHMDLGCLPSSYQTKGQLYYGPYGPTASIFYGI